jgi:hypothetical protein
MSAGAQRADIHKRASILHALLDQGFNADPEPLASVYDATFEQLDTLQQRESNLFYNAQTSHDDPEAKFGTLLDLYEMTFERFHPTLAAPYVAADCITRSGRQISDLIDSDGRVKLASVRELETKRGYAAGTLTGGSDNHLRNASAHHDFDILGDDKIRIWDLDPRTRKVTWGPIEWTYWELRTQTLKLSTTCYVMLLGIALFDLQYGPTIAARFRGSDTPRRRRRDVIEAQMRAMAESHGFDVTRVLEKGEDMVVVHLKVLGETLPEQTREVMEGTKPPRLYKQHVRTVHGGLANQVCGLLQMTADVHLAIDRIRIEVTDSDGKTSLGSCEADRELRERMWVGTDVKDVIAALDENSLADVEIPIVIRAPLQRVN